MRQGMSGAGLLAGRRGLIMGVANNRSIAWGIAEAAAKKVVEYKNNNSI